MAASGSATVTGMPVRASRIAATVALALAGGALAAGCGGAEERPATKSQPAGSTSDEKQTDSGPSGSNQSSSISQRSDGSGSSQSSSITQSSGGSSSSSQTAANGEGMSTFSGKGSTTLSFNVERPSRLVWTNGEGNAFSMRGGGVSVSSRAGHGELELKPGDYRDVRVRGSSWTIVVRPR